MGRNMLKWRTQRRYRLRDTPYAPLVESPDTTNAGNTKQSLKTKALRNKRSSGCLTQRAVINNANNGQSDVSHRNEMGDSEQSSFVTISSEELHLEDSHTESEQSQHVMRKAFRRFSEGNMASVAKMSAKWCKIRDTLVSSRKSSCTLPVVTDNLHTEPKSERVKPDAGLSTKSKNPLEGIKGANSLRNRQRRWSLFATDYVKLNNSDSSPSVAFDLENAAHSTFIKDDKDKQGNKRNERGLEGCAAVHQEPIREKFVRNTSLGCIRKHPRNYLKEAGKKQNLLKNRRSGTTVKKMTVPASAGPNISSERNIQSIKTKRFKGSVGATKLPKVRRRNDVYNLRTLSVKSSEGKVEVKISLELSEAGNRHRNSSTDSSRSGVTNKYYLMSPLKTVDVTPVLPKRPLSRRALFSEGSKLRETTNDGLMEIGRYDEARCSDEINMLGLNTAHNAKENNVHLSPHTGETEDQLITPPNSQEIKLSIKQAGKCRPRHVRKHRCVRY